MRYLLLFLEGIITFISPCILPMIPIYISYFMGAKANRKSHAIKNAVAFVCGFTVIFTLLGAAAGSIGVFFSAHMTVVNVISGIVMVIFGLNYLGLFKIRFLNGTYKVNSKLNFNDLNVISSIVFGVVFGIGWTPCVGPFLGSALMIASNSDHIMQGALMLFVYSLGLGIPFILSALLIHMLTGAFDFIKRHYGVVKMISGILLILIGLMMMTGYLNILLSFLAF